MNERKRIAVAGATGRLGRHIVDVVEERGHEVVPMSRSLGVDVVTGEGLAGALEGVETVIDAASHPTPEQGPATDFFVASSRNLHQLGAQAGVQRMVVVSIIGDRPLQRGLPRREEGPRAGDAGGAAPGPDPARGAVPRVRGRSPTGARENGVRYVPTMRTQLVAARTVAEALVDIATDRRGRGSERGRSRRSPARGRETSSTSPGCSPPIAARRCGSKASTDPADPDGDLYVNGGLLPARTPPSPARATRSGSRARHGIEHSRTARSARTGTARGPGRPRCATACPLPACTFVVQAKPRSRGGRHEVPAADLPGHGALDEFARLSTDEQEAIVDEYLAVHKSPGVVGGEQLQPVDTATTVRVEGGRRFSPTVRSWTRRSTSAASCSSRPTTSTGRSTSPRGSRPREWAARSRYGPWWRGRRLRCSSRSFATSGAASSPAWSATSATSTWPRTPRRRRSRSPPSAGLATARRPTPAPG